MAYFSFGSTVGVANRRLVTRRSDVVHAAADTRPEDASIVELHIALVDGRALTPRQYARHISRDAGDTLLRRIHTRCSPHPASQPVPRPSPLGAVVDPSDTKRSRGASINDADDANDVAREKDDGERDDWVVDFFEWAARRYASLSVDSDIVTKFLFLASTGREFGVTQRSFTAIVSTADAQLLLVDLVVRRQLMSSSSSPSSSLSPTPSTTPPVPSLSSSASKVASIESVDWRRGRAGSGPTYFHVHVHIPAHDSEPWREWASAYSVDSRGRPLRTTWRADTGAVSGDETSATATDDEVDEGEGEGDEGDDESEGKGNGGNGGEYEYWRAGEPTATATTTQESKEEKVDRAPVKAALSPLQKPRMFTSEDDGRQSSRASDGQRSSPASDGDREVKGDECRRVLEIRACALERMNSAWAVITRAQRRCLHGLAAAAASAPPPEQYSAATRIDARPSVSFRLPAPLAHLEAQFVAESTRRVHERAQ